MLLPMMAAAAPPGLAPAVPPYVPDVEQAQRMLGQAQLYIGQLAAELQQRAQVANELHDRVLALEAELAAACAQPPTVPDGH